MILISTILTLLTMIMTFEHLEGPELQRKYPRRGAQPSRHCDALLRLEGWEAGRQQCGNQWLVLESVTMVGLGVLPRYTEGQQPKTANVPPHLTTKTKRYRIRFGLVPETIRRMILSLLQVISGEKNPGTA